VICNQVDAFCDWPRISRIFADKAKSKISGNFPHEHRRQWMPGGLWGWGLTIGVGTVALSGLRETVDGCFYQFPISLASLVDPECKELGSAKEASTAARPRTLRLAASQPPDDIRNVDVL
jgi:hypothetical protein